MKLICRKMAFLTLVLLFFLSSIKYQGVSQETATPTTLSMIIYGDGVTHVTYVLDVDPSIPGVKAALFGMQYENLIVIDENSTFLDYSLEEPIIHIDSLGARSIRIEWDALDLTNKTSGIWTLAIDSPITFTAIFPKNTTIIDLSATPLEITFDNQRPILTMPCGLQTMSYIVGMITLREDARETLDAVVRIIATIKAKGIDVAEAESVLQEAEIAFAVGNYTGAEKLAYEALERAYALEARAEAFPTYFLLPLMGLPLVFVAGILLRRRLRDGKIDVDEVLREYPWLRDDQKEVLRFLAKTKEGIFEAELRRAFDLPKSSMWRLIKKLEEEDILTVQQLRGQNYIELKKKKR